MRSIDGLRLSFLLPLVLLLGSCSSASRNTLSETGDRQHRASRCMAYDGKYAKNGEGFASLDSTRDGVVDREEFYCLGGKQYADDEEVIVDSLVENGVASFEKADHDRSGNLSAQEFGRMKLVSAKTEKIDFVCVTNDTSQDLNFSLLPLEGPEAKTAIDFTVRAGSVFCDPSEVTRKLYQLELQGRAAQDDCDPSVTMVDGESLLVKEGPAKEKNCKILSAKGTNSFDRDLVVKNGSKSKINLRAVGGSCRCASFKPGATTVGAGAERRLRFFVDNRGKCLNISSECELEVSAKGMATQKLTCVGLQSEAACELSEDNSRLKLENGPSISLSVQ